MMTSQSKIDAMLSILEPLAVAAGHEIMVVRSAGCEVKHKSDQSPVTLADERAERIILDGLAKYYPDIPVVAEEAIAAGDIPEELNGCFFLVDALDGTREFVSGRDDFTVNIAFIDQGIPVVGIVYGPVHRQIFCGAGNHAYSAAVEDGKVGVLYVMNIHHDADNAAPRVVASRSHMTPETETYLAKLPGCKTVSVGSSLKFCLLAEGKADLYPRFGRTMEWDTAAGDAVLRAAGGMTSTLDGKPLQYGKRNQEADCDFANPHFVAKV